MADRDESKGTTPGGAQAKAGATSNSTQDRTTEQGNTRVGNPGAGTTGGQIGSGKPTRSDRDTSLTATGRVGDKVAGVESDGHTGSDRNGDPAREDDSSTQVDPDRNEARNERDGQNDDEAVENPDPTADEDVQLDPNRIIANDVEGEDKFRRAVSSGDERVKH